MSEEQPPIYIPQQTVSSEPAPVQIVKKTSGWKWFWIALMICFVVGCMTFFLVMKEFIGEIITQLVENPQFQAQCEESQVEMDPSHQLSEVVVKNSATEDKILIISLEGVFSDGGSYGSAGTIGAEYMKNQLRKAGNDDYVKAVVLRIDSPGGEAFTCDLIAEELRDFYARFKKPVVAWIGSMGASGGYYVSAPCQWIVAHEMSITGSIGVISSSFNYRGLLDKVGVKPVVYKSGRFKDMMSPSKAESDISAEERAMIQGLIDNMFGRFKKVVREGRNQEARKDLQGTQKLVENWEEYADGRVLLGQEAYKVGLVDELGGEEEAITSAKRLADIQIAKIIRYDSPVDWKGLLKFFSEAQSRRVEVNLNGLEPRSQGLMEPGKIYFLPPVE